MHPQFQQANEVKKRINSHAASTAYSRDNISGKTAAKKLLPNNQYCLKHLNKTDVFMSLVQNMLPTAIEIGRSAGKKGYYNILGVAKNASSKDIKKSYYQLAKKYHPNTNKNDPDAVRKFQEVSEA